MRRCVHRVSFDGMSSPLTSLSEADIAALARTALDFEIPAECLPGVRANLALLAEHLGRLEEAGE